MTIHQRLCLSAATCGIAAALLLFAGTRTIQKQHTSQQVSPVHSLSLFTSDSEKDAASHFLVKSYQGQVCVFPEGQALPTQNTGIWVSTLPDQDQALLEAGISVSSQQELSSLLEDYGY